MAILGLNTKKRPRPVGQGLVWLIGMALAHAADLATTMVGLRLGYAETNGLGSALIASGSTMLIVADALLVIGLWLAIGVLHPRVRRFAYPAMVILLAVPAVLNVLTIAGG